MKILNWNQLNDASKVEVLTRPVAGQSQELSEGVKAILESVKADQDKAVKEFTSRFDGVDLQELRVSEDEFAAAETLVDDEAKSAIDQAIANISAFMRHKNSLPLKSKPWRSSLPKNHKTNSKSWSLRTGRDGSPPLDGHDACHSG